MGVEEGGVGGRRGRLQHSGSMTILYTYITTRRRKKEKPDLRLGRIRVGETKRELLT